MRAIAYHKYYSPDVFNLEKIETPTAGDGEVLLKIGGEVPEAIRYLEEGHARWQQGCLRL